MILSVRSLFRKGQMQGAARIRTAQTARNVDHHFRSGGAATGAERTGSYARTGKRTAPYCGAVNAPFLSLGEASTAATPQMAFPGQAPYGGSLTSTGAGANVRLLPSRLSAT
jgi:hypothetical protein